MTLEPESLTLTTLDGVDIAATLFVRGDVTHAILIASAMGVPQRFYAAFATHLADQGAAVLTLDYRGIGRSKQGALRGADIDLDSWGRDLEAGLDALRTRFPNAALSWLGHSVGAQLLALVSSPEDIQRAVFVAGQSGHWRHWSGRGKLGMLALWYAAIPLIVPVMGKLPSALLGGGEDVPPGVARQWGRWGRHRDYIGVLPRPGFRRFQGSLVAYAITDDRFAPQAAVDALVQQYDAPDVRVVTVSPADVGQRTLGHFNVFREAVGRPLWPTLVEALLTAGAP